MYKHTKNYLPTISRSCLISTFIEDGLRMYFQWNEQRSYMNDSWGCGMFLASIFVLFNLFGQLGACVMVLLQKKVPHACGVLFSIVILQVREDVRSFCSYYCSSIVNYCILADVCVRHYHGSSISVKKFSINWCSSVARSR